MNNLINSYLKVYRLSTTEKGISITDLIIKHYCSMANLEKVLSPIAQGIFIFFNCQILEKNLSGRLETMIYYFFFFTIFISIWSNFCFFSLVKLERDGDVVALPVARTLQSWRHSRDVPVVTSHGQDALWGQCCCGARRGSPDIAAPWSRWRGDLDYFTEEKPPQLFSEDVLQNTFFLLFFFKKYFKIRFN